MARGLNQVVLLGSVTQTPDLRYTPGGLAILEITLAGTDRISDETGNLRELPWYHRVKLFGRYAEALADQVAAGRTGLAVGRLEYRTWEAEGGKRSALDVRADRFELLELDRATTSTDAKGQERLAEAVNQVYLIGNLTREPELRYTPQGVAVSRLGLAVNERFVTKGQEQEKTNFVDITAWRELAEWTGDLSKGGGVFVQGRLINDSWTSQTGERRFATRIEAHRMGRLERFAAGSAETAKPTGKRSVPDIEEGLLEDDFPSEEDLPF